MTANPAEGEHPVFVHPLGLCESDRVGSGTRVWAYAHVLSGARIGADCNLCDGVFVENDVVVGDRVTIKSGVQLWDGLRVGDDVFIGPNATLTNDRFPRSKAYDQPPAITVIEDGASLGANCTVLPGLRIGRNAMIGAGAVVTRDVPANAKVVGNPGRIIGYVDAEGSSIAAPGASRAQAGAGVEGELVEAGVDVAELDVAAIAVPGVRLIPLPASNGTSGITITADLERHVPFPVRSLEVVTDVDDPLVRIEHSRRQADELIVCLRGSVRILADDGAHRSEFRLDTPALAVMVPSGVWTARHGHSPDAVIAVLASLPVDDEDVVRTYTEFVEQGRQIGL